MTRLLSKNFLTLTMMCMWVTGCRTSDFQTSDKKLPALAPLQTREFSQPSREIRQIQFNQGISGQMSQESYNVTAKGIVDIVVVIDNSSSMAEEQRQLSSRMYPLLSAINESDWQIVVTTTDPDSGCGKGPIAKGESDAESRFSRYIQEAGINGNGIEQPFYQAVKALKSDCFLFGPGKWLRPNSTVAVVIVSDEDNCFIDSNNGYGCFNDPSLESSYLTNYLSSIRQLGKDARVYGLFWHPSQSKAQCSTAYKEASKIAQAVQVSGGTWGSICDLDYSGTLASISRNVAQILNADFVLRSIPDAGTLRIMVNGQVWSDFTQVAKAVHFTRSPPVGAGISVSYRSGASGVVSQEFDIQEVPVPESISATVNGQNAGTVTYNPATRKVTFAQRPVDGGKIVVSYKVATPLVTIFPIATNADVASIVVKVNGVLVPPKEYTYDKDAGTIKFQTAPVEGAKINVQWRGSKVIS